MDLRPIESMTPEQMKGEVAETISDSEGPYFNGLDPRHSVVVERMTNLHKRLYPEPSGREGLSQDHIDFLNILEAGKRQDQRDVDHGLQTPDADLAHAKRVLAERWGSNFDENLRLAKEYYARRYSAEDKAELEKYGRDNDPAFIMDMLLLAKGEKK
jgi:hypothetical protein